MQPQRILIVKLTAIGDVIHALPVASALRDHFPQALIAWAIEGRAADLIRGHRAIDEVIALPRHWVKSPREVLRVRKTLRERRFDTTLDLQGLTKSALAALLSGARKRLGFGGQMGREISPLLNNRRVYTRSPHVVDRYLELLVPLGIKSPAVKFDVPRRPDDVATVAKMLASTNSPRSFALINPGAGWASKRWPPDRYAAVARHLGERRRLPSLVVWAGGEEKVWAEQIVAESNSHARLAPDTTLSQLAELARRAMLFVGSDTGPLHLAAAVGTPCVGMFGPMDAERNGPYGPQNVSVQKARMQGSSREKRNADNATMLAITVDDTCRACDQALAKAQAPYRAAS